MNRSPAVPLVRIRQLVVSYGEVPAVRGATLSISDGGLTVLVGPSGCGKTSLLRALAGFERPISGSIEMNGKTLCGDGVFLPAESREIGMVFQEGALFPHLSVRDNVRYGLSGVAAGADSVDMLLAEAELEPLADRFPDQLSGGQQQRVALARALAPSPQLVLLDEPFASLDATRRIRMRAQVKAILRARGRTAMMVTHDQEEALSIADRVAVMLDGRIVQAGTPRQIYRRPATPEVAEFIGGGQLLACRIGETIESPLGSLRWTAAAPIPAPGSAQLLVRPEQLEGTDAGQGVAAKFVSCEYYGHDSLATVQLDSGRRLQLRLSGGESLRGGDSLGLRLRNSTFLVYPGDGAEPGTVEPV